ncbi:MAG: hypothetical protein M5R36_06430 [Deltaproteobacteria bacterium]|nr:hypothetical protein [Deltaproteobacteria bacterium]
MAQAALTAAVLAWLFPIFLHPFAIVGEDAGRTHDYLQQATYDHLFRRAILDEGAWPLRTHLLGGGYPLSANPQDTAFTPFSLTTLAFGEALGVKINIALFFLVGVLGFYRLARETYECGASASAFGALAFAVSGWWLSRVEWGDFFKLYFHLVPWIWLFLSRAAKGRPGVLAAGLLLAAAMTQLGLGFVVIGLYLVLHLALESWNEPAGGARKASRAAGFVVAAFAASCVFGAAKLVPMAGLLLENPRAVETYDLYLRADGLGWPHFYESFAAFARALFFHAPVPKEPIAPGWAAVPLAIAGVMMRPKRLWPLAVTSMLFALICFGPFLGVDLFRPLWALPIFHSMHRPYQLFSLFVLTGIALAAAVGLEEILRRFAARQTLIAAVAFALTAPTYFWAWPVLSRAFVDEAPRLEKTASFYFVQGEDMARGAPRSLHTQQYFNVLRGVGTIDWDGDVLLPEHAAPKFFFNLDDARRDNADYRGEVYFARGGGEIASWTIASHRLTATGRADGDALIVFNQNFDPYFRANVPLIDYQGLIGARVGAGSFDIGIRYRPWPTYAGMAASFLSIAAFAFVSYRRRRN